MNYAHYIKEIGRGAHGSRDLSIEDADQLYAAMLDGGVPDLELGAISLALRMKTESVTELIGFYNAVSMRLHRLEVPDGKPRPVVIPTYNGTRQQPNLMPLIALELERFGVPVLMHGALDGGGRSASAYVLRELGVLPCATLGQAQQALDAGRVTFVPTAVLSPGLAELLALRSRLGVRNSAHTLAKLIDPFGGAGVRMVGVTHPDYLQKLREFFAATGERALLMRGTEGEAFANPRKRPRIEFHEAGECTVLFEEERMATAVDTCDMDVKATAAWIGKALRGAVPLPMPIVNQLACCLYCSRYAEDFNQAKAIVALETCGAATA
ncbi:MAG: DNA-binding protein YbiB [Burkholderiales bacterium]|nr:DNA-binding protein YbiB [Burkholderiales bacterium]